MLFSSLISTFSRRGERQKEWTWEVLKSISKLKSVSVNFKGPCLESIITCLRYLYQRGYSVLAIIMADIKLQAANPILQLFLNLPSKT
jgi:hypothetical protein